MVVCGSMPYTLLWKGGNLPSECGKKEKRNSKRKLSERECEKKNMHADSGRKGENRVIERVGGKGANMKGI